ncbi:hypothetical protein [Phaeospirillum tilakii]|uniref:Uncharacterized protein n=1 Tax=Phaeospirillum tilakii TaxID=741673 RepID=A0ABW5CD53_9PROT
MTAPGDDALLLRTLLQQAIRGRHWRTALLFLLFRPWLTRLLAEIRANPGAGDKPSPFIYTIR